MSLKFGDIHSYSYICKLRVNQLHLNINLKLITMKKNLFILGFAALAFAACSNDEVVEVNHPQASLDVALRDGC